MTWWTVFRFAVQIAKTGVQQLLCQAVEAELPWLHLKSVSSGEMGESLKVLVGQEAKAKLKRS